MAFYQQRDHQDSNS